jgi:acetyltransferase-like isoleucine patch superfamily enzyme
MRRGRLSRNRTNVDTSRSKLKGFAGLVERLLRTFRDIFHILLMLPLYCFGIFLVGIAMTPGLWCLREVILETKSWPLIIRLFSLGSASALAYFLYGISLVLLLPACNSLFQLRLKAWRGPYYSLATIPWYIHNGLTYVLRFTFLEFITPTPIGIFFFRAMGMKIGKGTIINSSCISDPSLIELGEKVTIGGSVTLVAHYGQAGFLVLAPVIIGPRATIGLRCSIMGGVKIGADAKILPHSVVMPKTIIGEGEIWGGVPAVKVGEGHVLSAIKSKRTAS